MKTTKKFISFVLVIFVLSVSIIPVYAADSGISPRYNNTATTETGFYIDENGVAWVSAMYGGYSYTTFACIQIKIEKRVLFWWEDVENGWTDNTYVTELWGQTNFVNYSLQLEKTGKYRATVTYTVNGTGGDSDIITSVLEYEY